MDNHRAALWCWQQHVDRHAQPHGLIHIDRHYDALSTELGAHVAAMPNLRGLSIEGYLGAQVQLPGAIEPDKKTALFRWDNYLSIYLSKFAGQLGCFRCITHEDGGRPDFDSILESPPQDLPANLEYWLFRSGDWIVNIDLDFFYCAGPGDDEFLSLLSDEYIDTACTALRRAMDAGLVSVVTVCLTPTEFTPGWDACLALSRRIFRILGAPHPNI